ncbi:MAG: hypothetical protein ACKVT0_07440 [Planctomycetaceae bacterium]
MSSLRSLLFVVTGGMLISGCLGGGPSEPPLGSVKGTVKINGQPTASLEVVFEPQIASGQKAADVGAASRAITDAGGAYELIYKQTKGAVIGTHTIRINRAAAGGPAGGEGGAKLGAPIPENYNAKSNITKEVKAGENTIDIDITL